MITEEQLNSRLVSMDPAREIPEFGEELHQLLRSVSSSERTVRRKKWAGIGVAAALVVGSGAVAWPVAADVIRHFFVQDTPQLPTTGSEVIPGSEWLDTSKGDIAEYLVSIYPSDLPLPAGYTKSKIITMVAGFAEANPGVTQKVGFERSFENIAYCGWVDQWLAADTARDDAKIASATAVLQDALDWPAYVATDGGQIMDLQRAYAKAARTGDRAGLLPALVTNDCDLMRIGAK